MRVAFFLLLLVNLAFFAWAQWLAPEGSAASRVAQGRTPPQLRLAAEASPVATDGSCVTVGPVRHQRARRARAPDPDRQRLSVGAARGHHLGARRLLGLSRSPTTEAGERRLLDRLHRGGIDDAQAVGEIGARRISLGVFTDEARAIAQSERVARLGLLPQIVAREKASTAIWLDLTLKTGAPPLEGQKFQAGDTELEFRPCPAEAGGGAEAQAQARTAKNPPRNSAARGARLKSPRSPEPA